MPIIYRNREREPSADRCPPWLVGALDLQRQSASDGDLIGFWQPLYCDAAVETQRAMWHDLSDHWQVCLVGELVPATMLRQAADTPALLPVADSKGRAWHAPAILQPPPAGDRVVGDGTVAIPLAFGKNPAGTWCRCPTPAQAAWIGAAQAARREIVAGTIASVPLSVVSEWALVLTTAVYHLNDEVIAALGLYDDRLVLQTLLASAGCIPTQAAIA